MPGVGYRQPDMCIQRPGGGLMIAVVMNMAVVVLVVEVAQRDARWVIGATCAALVFKQALQKALQIRSHPIDPVRLCQKAAIRGAECIIEWRGGGGQQHL